MFNYYELDIIPIILKRFKVDTIISTGIIDEKTFKFILEFCDENNSSNVVLESNNALKELSNFKNYEAIFLNDDPNWYTLYNELNIIKQHNDEFPLVFICNNIFPHKRRDSYYDPKKIPEKFRNEYSKEFIYGGMIFHDDFFHANLENTPKNGVLTAIEDFLNENDNIDLMEIKFLNGMIILYPKNSISQIRWGVLLDEIEEYVLNWDMLSDSIFENKFLNNYIHKFYFTNDDYVIEDFKVELNEKEKVIREYGDKIKLNDVELSYKDSQIDSFISKLDIKDLEIKNVESKLVNSENKISYLNNELKNVESKLVNSENKISYLNNELKNADNQINFLKNEITQKENNEKELYNNLQLSNDKIKNQEKDISIKDNQIIIKEKELNDKNLSLNSIKQKYFGQLSKLDNKEYCIKCYKDKLEDNQLEIQYLKNDSLIKKLLNPFSYIFLILKSNPKELSINFKLYKAIKNSACFDIGYYLKHNNDLLESKWCKFFSPELHYVCIGFNESRKFNKKYFNRTSKEELLNYILKC